MSSFFLYWKTCFSFLLITLIPFHSILANSYYKDSGECCEEENSCLSNKAWIIGAAVGGAVVGGVVGASINKGKKGSHGSSGATGATGQAGPAGEAFVAATGPASLAFTFTSIAAEGSTVVFTPLVVRPDGVILAGTPMGPDSPAQMFEVAAPAPVGSYTIAFYVDSILGASSTFGAVTVTNSLNPAEFATYEATANAITGPGDEITFNFVYSPAVIP